MISWLKIVLAAVFSGLKTRRELALENLALRQQLAVMHRSVKRPKLTRADRVFWVVLSRWWKGWQSPLAIFQPATVVRWHRLGFRLYWRWKSRRRGKGGRPPVPKEIQNLIKRISLANPLWGVLRIQGELAKLGIEVADSTVAKYRIKSKKPPSLTWRAFLRNHAKATVGIDFFIVPTVTFHVLYVLVVLRHWRRKVVHFNVTMNPTADWTAQQIVEAFPWDTAPKYLLRDRDGIYGPAFVNRVKGMGIKEVKTAYHSPWQNPCVERLIGTIRRDCLNHIIILNERHLKAILREYFAYYHESRTHLSLERDAPYNREAEPPLMGEIIELDQVGGLHHRYTRQAA